MGFLGVIVDCNACNWGFLLENQADKANAFQKLISAISSFCNAHLLSSLNNELLLVAGGINDQNKKLFSSVVRSSGNHVSEIEYRIREALTKSAHENKHGYITSKYAAAVSLSICSFQRFKKETNEQSGRIVIINLSSDLSYEQNKLMNLFFSANQQNIEVNVASLNGTVVPILQQACDITSGTHMLIDQTNILAQKLMECCLIDSIEKDLFILQKSDEVDYRATCHCHNQLVYIGWVCSVCLTIHCSRVQTCSICKAFFPNSKIIQKNGSSF